MCACQCNPEPCQRAPEPRQHPLTSVRQEPASAERPRSPPGRAGLRRLSTREWGALPWRPLRLVLCRACSLSSQMPALPTVGVQCGCDGFGLCFLPTPRLCPDVLPSFTSSFLLATWSSGPSVRTRVLDAESRPHRGFAAAGCPGAGRVSAVLTAFCPRYGTHSSAPPQPLCGRHGGWLPLPWAVRSVTPHTHTLAHADSSTHNHTLIHAHTPASPGSNR